MKNRIKIFALLIAIFVVSLLLNGCSNSPEGKLTQSQVDTLMVTSYKDSVTEDSYITITAYGVDKDGNYIQVEPEWSIVKGAGSIESDGSQAKFQAGPFIISDKAVIEAKVGDLTKEITINILPLQANVSLPPIPEPDSLDDALSLPTKTEAVLEVGKQVDYLRLMSDTFPTPTIIDGTRIYLPVLTEYVVNGEIKDPLWSDAPINIHNWDGGVPYIAHKMYWERVGEVQILDPGTSYGVQYTVTKGTSESIATDFSMSITASVEAGWGPISASLSTSFSAGMSHEVSISKEVSVSKDYHVDAHDTLDTVYAVWALVDEYYLSDSNGVPIQDAPGFKDHINEHNVRVPDPVVVRGVYRQKVTLFEH